MTKPGTSKESSPHGEEAGGRMFNIIFGLCLICLGLVGITQHWWAVIDFVNVLLPVALFLFGVVALMAGIGWRKN
jgi:hypothetical protein